MLCLMPLFDVSSHVCLALKYMSCSDCHENTVLCLTVPVGNILSGSIVLIVKIVRCDNVEKISGMILC